MGPACIPPAPSSALPHLCISATALLQSQSCAVTLEAERFPPGLSSDGWSRPTAPQALDLGCHFPSLSLTPWPLGWAGRGYTGGSGWSWEMGVGSGMWWLAIPPGRALCSWWVHSRAGEASGLTGKHEEPRPLHRGKSPSEPLVNLDASAALLCQSHQPCVSRGWRRHRSQPPTEPPFLTPVVRGLQLRRLLPGA